VDFFTPIVDDPRTFGRIAAANALSDVYAKGAKPLTALNIICFPSEKMDISILHDILLGGLDTMNEADVLLVGGHSVDDREIKYGLSVTGIVHPDRVIRNRGARPGDRLILTKPLGTGIANTALKANMAPEALVEASIRTMASLNRAAAEAMAETPGVHACTDITGFGFLGHAAEMVEDGDVGFRIHASRVPLFQGIRDFVEMGILPAGLYRNRDFRMAMIDIRPECPPWIADVLFDPQTSGGLLIVVAAESADALLSRIHNRGIPEAAIVGDVTEENRGKITVS